MVQLLTPGTGAWLLTAPYDIAHPCTENIATVKVGRQEQLKHIFLNIQIIIIIIIYKHQFVWNQDINDLKDNLNWPRERLKVILEKMMKLFQQSTLKKRKVIKSS